jgi:hypothetical protein
VGVGVFVEVGEGDGLEEGEGAGVGLGVGVGVGVGVGLGVGGLLIPYSAASIIIAFVLSMVVVTTRPFSSMPSEYPFVGVGS